ncbi:MAG: hypothetical protein DRQ55_17145 [Planctomycetota bacterium]|nr:MAG: hypothetical protein DRQ55_17145 [Planctomycetota bacterium]
MSPLLTAGPRSGPSQTTRRPMKLPSANHQTLLGRLGSLAFQWGVSSRRRSHAHCERPSR